MHRDISSNGHKFLVWIISLCCLYASLLRHYIDTIERAFARKDTLVSYSCKNSTVLGEERNRRIIYKRNHLCMTSLIIDLIHFLLHTYIVCMKCSSRICGSSSTCNVAPTRPRYTYRNICCFGDCCVLFRWWQRNINSTISFNFARWWNENSSNRSTSLDEKNSTVIMNYARFYRQSWFERSPCQ